MSNLENLYNERINRLKTTARLEEPDRVPIISSIGSWAISNAGSTFQECLDDPQKELEVFAKPFKDIYFDAGAQFGIGRPMKFYDALGNNQNFVSEDGTTMQQKESVQMKETEYDELISNTFGFLDNEICKRKYPALRKPYPENKESMKAAIIELFNFFQRPTGAQYLKENYGVPLTAIGLAEAPADLIFDFLRGFVPFVGDVRRCPEKIAAAADNLVEFLTYVSTGGASEMDEFPWVVTPLHVPTYLSPKQFETIYWPSYKKLLLNIHKRGGKVNAILEGDWTRLYDYIQELPKGLVIAAIEKDDMANAKKKLGNTVSLMGGMPLSLLKHATKQECIDYAKNVVDICAPGGGYMFSTDLSMLSKGDVNVENLIAVNEFVHEYGIYK